MQSDIAELSTIGAQLEDLAARVEAVGDRYRLSPDSAVTNDIDIAERSLIGARRAIDRAARLLAGSA
jgi:serine acetyltransferase